MEWLTNVMHRAEAQHSPTDASITSESSPNRGEAAPTTSPSVRRLFERTAKRATIKEDLHTDHPLGYEVDQGVYGSCQMLAALDSVSRRAGGVRYLTQGVTRKDDGTYDVTLHDIAGNPLIQNIDPEKLHVFWRAFTKVDPALIVTIRSNDAIKRDLEANSAKIVKLYELAYLQAIEYHPEKVPGRNLQWALISKNDAIGTDMLSNLSPTQLQEASLLQLSFPLLRDAMQVGQFNFRPQHAYAMTYDANADTVTLRNPHHSRISLTLPRKQLEALKPEVVWVTSKELERNTAEYASHMQSPTVTEQRKRDDLLDISDVNLNDTHKTTLYRTLLENQGKPNTTVGQVQKQLVALGFLDSNTFKPAYFDDATALAVQKFQHKHFGSPSYTLEEMVIDLKTLMKLHEEKSKLSQQPPRHSDASSFVAPLPTPSIKVAGAQAR
jgi:hypothetical protein